MKNFFTGAELREIRENMALTLSELAEKSGVSKSSIGNFETGARGLGKKARHAIEAALSANRKNADSQTLQQKSDDSTAPPPQNPPEQKSPSPADMELLHRLYALKADALPMYDKAQESDDYSEQIVPSLVLNLISLLRRCDSSTAELGKITTLLHLLNAAKAGERSQIDPAKTLLDKM